MKTGKDRPSLLLIGYNFSPEPTGIGKYSGEMLEWLTAHGVDCTVITTYPYYPHWKVQEPYRQHRYWYKTEIIAHPSGGSVKVIRCPIYVPFRPSGAKRMMLDISFLISSFFPLIRLLFKRRKNTVMAVVPSFLLGLPASFYKRMKKARMIYHVQDMQIEAAADLGMIKSKALIRLLFRLEKHILKRSDTVSSISAEMMLKIEEKAGKPVYFLPNWTDVKRFHPIANIAEVKAEYGFNASDFVVLYSGAIGQKQGLEAILESALHFKKNSSRLQFVICGSGPYRQSLEEKARGMELDNLRFLPLQPLESFNAFLNMADIHLVIQKANASDLMMPSKLTTILAVGGLAIITANEGSGLFNLVQTHNVGILAEAENQMALQAAIEYARINNKESQNIKGNARSYAEAYLNIDSIMERFKTDLL